MSLTKEQVLKIVDSCFHCYASYYRSDAIELATALIADIEAEQELEKSDDLQKYSVIDLEEAYSAGEEVTNYDWHMDEYHGTKCKCKPPKYENFGEYLKHIHEKIH